VSMIESSINHEIERKSIIHSVCLWLIIRLLCEWFALVHCCMGVHRDYDSFFLATVMHNGPRMIRIVSIISCVERLSTISSLICCDMGRKKKMKRKVNSIRFDYGFGLTHHQDSITCN
jgi:hypothetical protein